MISDPKPLLKTVRCQHGNAWLVLSMPDDKTIQITGEWHTHWVDTKLTYDTVLKQPWSELLGTDTKVVNRARARATVNHWVQWLKARHSKSSL